MHREMFGLFGWDGNFITSNLKIMASHLRVCRHKIKQLNGQGKKRRMDKDQMVKSCGIILTLWQNRKGQIVRTIFTLECAPLFTNSTLTNTFMIRYGCYTLAECFMRKWQTGSGRSFSTSSS